MRGRLLAPAILLAGATLTLCVALHRAASSEPAPADQPGSQAEPEIALTGKRRTAAQRDFEALRRQGFGAPSQPDATAPAVARDVRAPFGHKEGFPKAWLAPDERPAWPDPREP